MSLPALVQRFVTRTTSSGTPVPEVVRAHQEGEMWRTPGSRGMRFTATEEFSVRNVAFSWRARFTVVGPIGMTVVDELADDAGRLRVSVAGIPLQTQRGPETNVGQAMRYLAELVWAPYAIAANRELEWRTIDDRRVEVACEVAGGRVSVRWELDDAGDVVRATAMRPMPAGKEFVATSWGGDFGDYRELAGTRVPTFAEAWWDLAAGRFVYWRGRITALELVETRQ